MLIERDLALVAMTAERDGARELLALERGDWQGVLDAVWAVLLEDRRPGEGPHTAAKRVKSQRDAAIAREAVLREALQACLKAVQCQSSGYARTVADVAHQALVNSSPAAERLLLAEAFYQAFTVYQAGDHGDERAMTEAHEARRQAGQS